MQSCEWHDPVTTMNEIELVLSSPRTPRQQKEEVHDGQGHWYVQRESGD